MATDCLLMGIRWDLQHFLWLLACLFVKYQIAKEYVRSTCVGKYTALCSFATSNTTVCSRQAKYRG
jgi:hypothetical protein